MYPPPRRVSDRDIELACDRDQTRPRPRLPGLGAERFQLTTTITVLPATWPVRLAACTAAACRAGRLGRHHRHAAGHPAGRCRPAWRLEPGGEPADPPAHRSRPPGPADRHPTSSVDELGQRGLGLASCATSDRRDVRADRLYAAGSGSRSGAHVVTMVRRRSGPPSIDCALFDREQPASGSSLYSGQATAGVDGPGGGDCANDHALPCAARCAR
jgi:hypothetical protein